MKKFSLICALLAAAPLMADGEATAQEQSQRIAVVSLRQCIEQSNFGKDQEKRFEEMKSNIQSSLAEKESELKEMIAKLNDEDYLDSLSSEAEDELKMTTNSKGQELQQMQQHFMQLLQQTQMQVVQQIGAKAQEAAAEVAKELGYDLVLNEESCFFASSNGNITTSVITKMNANKEKEDAAAKASAAEAESEEGAA